MSECYYCKTKGKFKPIYYCFHKETYSARVKSHPNCLRKECVQKFEKAVRKEFNLEEAPRDE